MKDFIEVTSVYDGRKSFVRAVEVVAVHDILDDTMKIDEFRQIVYGTGNTIDVIETLDEIMGAINVAEM